MTAKVILALLIQFSLLPDDPRLPELARVLAKYPKAQIIELIGIMIKETGIRMDVVSSSECVCWTQQQYGEEHEKPSKEALRSNTELCITETIEDLAYWKEWCGPRYLDAYWKGWSHCTAGKYYVKYKDDPKRKKKWCHGPKCTAYTQEVRANERKVRKALKRREK